MSRTRYGAAVRRRRPRAGLALAGAAATTLLAVTACTASSSSGSNSAASGSSSPAASGGTLTVALSAAISTLNPAQSQVGWASNAAIQLAYAPLIQLTNAGSYAPGLATSWGYTDKTNTTFQLKIRPGAKFSDGTPVTAAAVAASINYIRTAGGANAAMFSSLSGATATGTSTVVVTASTPDPNIPYELSQAGLGGDVISPAGLKTQDQLKAATFGAGEYTLDPGQTVTGDHYTFVKNNNYYDPSAIHYDKVVVKVIPTANAVLDAIQSGQVDFAAGDFSTTSAASSADVQISTIANYLAGFFIADRTGASTPALGNLGVRQAMNYAINRTALAKGLFGSYGKPTSAMSAPGQDNYSDAAANMYPYDPAKAKQLLAAAGYPNGFTVKLDATVGNYNNGGQVAQAAVAQLKAVGINVDIVDAPDIPTYSKNALSKTFGLIYMSYPASSMTLMYRNLASGMTTVYNPFGSTDPAATALMKQASSATGASASDPLFQQALLELTKQGWFLPMVNHDLIFYSGSKLGGVPSSFDVKVTAPDVTEFYAK